MAWRRTTVAGRQSQSANGDASGNSHMEGGGVRQIWEVGLTGLADDYCVVTFPMKREVWDGETYRIIQIRNSGDFG